MGMPEQAECEHDDGLRVNRASCLLGLLSVVSAVCLLPVCVDRLSDIRVVDMN